MPMTKIKNTKVIHVTLGRINLKKSNGVIQVVHNLLTALSKETSIRSECWGLVNKNKSKVIDEFENERNYQLLLLPFTLISLLRKIKKEYSKPYSVIFHLHGSLNYQLHFFAFLLKIFSMKYIVSPHGGCSAYLIKQKSLLKKIYFRTFVYLFLKGASKVHLFSEEEIGNCSTLLRKLPHFFVPNGCHKPPSISTNFVPPKSPIFGFCGRLSNREKGIISLVKAFINYRKLGGAGKLSIIGDGPDYELIKKIKEKSLFNTDITLHGECFGDKKNLLVNQFTSNILPSFHEGMPISILESAALGKHLIVSKYTNLSSAIIQWNSGIIIQNIGCNEICNALFILEKIYRINPSSFYPFTRSIQMVESNFLWNIVATDMAQEYITINK